MDDKTDWGRLSYPHLCGLLGAKPSRLSQAMHNAGFVHLRLPFVYTAFCTTDTVAGLHAMRGLGFRGLSLTIPHKETAPALVDGLSSDAAEIKAINTVINNGEGLYGFNTDWYGVKEALREVQFSAQGKTALVFGAGGAARAALYALKQAGVAKLCVANRSPARAEDLARALCAEPVSLDALSAGFMERVHLFVNATPIGLALAGESQSYPFPLEAFGQGQYVFEMVTRETELSLAAARCGATVIPGMRMLLDQALKQFELFTEHKPPRREMEEALAAEIKRQM